MLEHEECFMQDSATLACSLAPPLQIPTKLSPLRRSVSTGQPFAMKLPLASPTRCKLCAVIRFLSAKGTTPINIHCLLYKIYGPQCMVWTSKSCRSGSESSRMDVQMSMMNSVLVGLRFRPKPLQKWSKNKKCFKIGM